MTRKRLLRTLLPIGLLCGAGPTVWADDTVKFQVDLTRYTNSLCSRAVGVSGQIDLEFYSVVSPYSRAGSAEQADWEQSSQESFSRHMIIASFDFLSALTD